MQRSDYPSSIQDIDPNTLAAGIMVLVIFSFVCYLIIAFVLSRLFKKAGLPQWEAWVPVYNHWRFLELGGQMGFWALFAYIPFINAVTVIVSLIYTAMAAYQIGIKLGKEKWFVLVAIFLPVVWLVWLAFDDSKWPKQKPFTAAKAHSKKKPTKNPA